MKVSRTGWLSPSFLLGSICVLIFGFGFSINVAGAEKIIFPEEELASESVMPIFDHSEAIKNRNVLTQKRFEVGPTMALSLLEPFYNPISIGASVSYHKSEEHAFNFQFAYFLQGLSNNANGLNPIPNTTTNVNLQYAPAPKYLLLGNYQYSGFYGKISLSKEFVMNLSLFALGGLGAIGVGDALCPAGNIGMGQKLYFSPNFAIRFDLRLVLYQGPDILSKNLNTKTSEQPASSFDQKINFSSLLSVGAVYLFPGM